MEHRAPRKRKHLFCPYTHPWPLGMLGDLGQNIIFLKVAMLHIKLKGMGA